MGPGPAQRRRGMCDVWLVMCHMQYVMNCTIATVHTRAAGRYSGVPKRLVLYGENSMSSFWIWV